MAPPAIAKIAAGLKAQKKGDAPEPPKCPDHVTKDVQKPKMEYFSKFPVEIQQMIWSEAMQKPACHTFRFVHKNRAHFWDYKYMYGLSLIPSNHDPSAYRYWKSLVWCTNYKLPMDDSEKKPKKRDPKAKERERPKLEEPDREKFNIEKVNQLNKYKPMVKKSHEAFSKLANISFDAGFQKSMVQFEPVMVDRCEVAAMDVATDLVILEFDRGENARPNAWFEHGGGGELDIRATRIYTTQLKRVAVHYKKSHALASNRGPFQCWCPLPSGLQCEKYKACPMEQACFLDSFEEMEEFYYVVEVTKKKERAWLDEYKAYALGQGYKLKKSDDPQSAKFQLAHFYDRKNEFLQLCPWGLLKFLPKELTSNKTPPLEAMGDPRDCLIKVMDIYRGETGKDDFTSDLEKRKKVKFGILVSYKIEN